MRFVSKPVETEAIQVQDDNAEAVRAFIQLHDPGPRHQDGYDSLSHSVWVTASQAWCDIAVGGYVMAERNGPGVYPCRQADFEDRWEQADG